MPVTLTQEKQSVPTEDYLPEWQHLISEDTTHWFWNGNKLIHHDRVKQEIRPRPNSMLQRFVVEQIYATQKLSSSVKKCLGRLFKELEATEGGWGLNLGSGETNYHKQILNLDIQDSDHIDILNLGSELPFADNSLDLVISQEVLEHIEEPLKTIEEVHRVLRPGGKFYCQVPFIIGFHPGPCDYWRFSRQAYEQLFSNQHWLLEELGLSLGHGSGFYRILVEFMAVNASILSQRLYKPAKGAAAVLFKPIQWFDLLTPFSAEKDRIPGGYYCVSVKQ